MNEKATLPQGIHIARLSIGYGQHVVGSGLEAGLAAGRLTCLVGRNGAGKSTLLKTLAGLLKPLAGSVTVDGHDLYALTRQQRARMVAVVLTGRPEVCNITVAELVAMGRQPYTNLWGTLSDDDRRVVEESMERVGIGALRDRMAQTLSDGEWQKTVIAKALAQQTPVVLLDEPTAFLDYPSKVETLTLLARLARQTGKTIVLSTHELELAARLADAFCRLEDSRLTMMTREAMNDYIKLQQR